MKKQKKLRYLLGLLLLAFVIAVSLYLLQGSLRSYPISNSIKSERLCFAQYGDTNQSTEYQYAFVDLIIRGTEATADLRLSFPRLPIVPAHFTGMYTKEDGIMEGIYSGKFQGEPFSESRVAEMTSDGIIFAKNHEELMEIHNLPDDVYLVPGISCERYDFAYAQYVDHKGMIIDTYPVE